jgi:hypothetical protein
MNGQLSDIMIQNPCPGDIRGPASVPLATLKEKWETGKPKKTQKQWIERTTTLHNRYAAYEEVYFSMNGRFWASFRTEIYKIETSDGRGRFLLLTIDISNKDGNEKPSISTCYINGPHSVEEILGSYLYSQIYDEDVAVNGRRPMN